MSGVDAAHRAATPSVQRPVATAPSVRRFDVDVPGVKYLTMPWQSGPTKHRANYIFERGTWRATCRECGWQTSDAARRQAALLFRGHIRQTAEEARSAYLAALAGPNEEEA